MSKVDHVSGRGWSNYHATRAFLVADASTFRADPAPSPDGPARFAETARTLREHLASLAGSAHVGLSGAAWSLSDLVGGAARMLDTRELGGVSWVEPPHLHHRSRIRPREAVFVGGGATWEALVRHVEGDPFTPRSILTCGSYLQQSVAGAVATSTAGSRLGAGAVQNQIVGIHLVTSAGSTWVERASDPVIGHVALDFADEVVRDDAVFEGALVHLGGMGLVNGLVVETTSADRFTATRMTAPLGAGWTGLVETGDFAAVARSLGHDVDPAYYEVQLDPFGVRSSPALHTLYFAEAAPAAAGPSRRAALAPARALRVNDALARVASRPAVGVRPSPAPTSGRCPGMDCADLGNALADLFRYYSCCHFQDHATSAPATWGAIHAQPPRADQQGVVFSAAFAVPRGDLGRALVALEAATAGRPRQFLYTLRFVSGAAGALAFQAFPDSVVIDFEGLKPTPAVERECAASLALAHRALRDAGVAFRPHWGKLGSPDAAEVEASYGPSSDPRSRLGRWLAARARLVPASDADLFRNDALGRWRL